MTWQARSHGYGTWYTLNHGPFTLTLGTWGHDDNRKGDWYLMGINDDPIFLALCDVNVAQHWAVQQLRDRLTLLLDQLG